MTAQLRAVLAFLLSTILILSVLLGPAPRSEANEGPESWAKDCNVPGLALAPVISADRDNTGAPVVTRPNTRGTYVPVIYVHGWTSTSIHDEARKGAFSAKPDLLASRNGSADSARTLIGNIQDLGGTAVFTFDYQKYGSRWVTDENIGPALAKSLSCLYESSGEKPIVVAHSMGGLATREALAVGDDLANKVSQVITFGTPNTGSLPAAIMALGLDAAAAVDIFGGPKIALTFRLILSYCGQLKTIDQNHTNFLCSAFMPAFLASFDSEAAVALRAGSEELKALAGWPAGLPIHGLVGDTQLTLVEQGFFLQKERTTAGLGDVVVGLESAEMGTTTSDVVSCPYDLNPVTSFVNDIRVNTLGITSKDEASRTVIDLLTTPLPCFHSNLMRNANLAVDELTYIAEDLAARTPATKVVTLRPWRDGSESMATETIDGSSKISSSGSANGCNGSNLTARADVFRCYAGSVVYDPCFVNPDVADEYLCVLRGKTIILQNVEPTKSMYYPGTEQNPEYGIPFKVELADGTECAAHSGAGPKGIPGYPYWRGSCVGAHPGIWRARDLDASGQSLGSLYDRSPTGVWQIAIGETETSPAELYPVAIAYR